MNIAKQSARRPIAIFMLLAAILVIGTIALRKLHLELLPQLEYPYAAVFATCLGMGTEEMEQLVTEPLEKAIATVPGVKNFTSVSQPGLSLILVEYEWGVDVLTASSRLERYLNIAQADLPEQVRPTVVEFDPSILPVFVFATTENPDTFIDRIKRLPDVAGVENLGKPGKIVRVTIDQQKARDFGLDLTLVDTFLAGNVVYPMGQLTDENGSVYAVMVDGRFKNIEELKNTVVGFRGLSYQMAMSGQMPKLLVPVRLGQVADVQIVDEQIRGLVRVDGQQSSVVSVRKRAGANTVNSVRQVKKLLDESKIPYSSLIDQSLYTEKAINNLLKNLVLGLIGAAVVVMVFVLDIKSTIIVSLSIPISLIVAIVLMYLFRINIDLLTLGGLTMAVGMLVDNAIVVFENIYRYKSENLPYDEAAAKGTKEVFGAIFASTATTIIVYVPLLFTESFAATMFKYFAATLSLSLGASLLVAGILIPAGSRWVESRKMQTFERVKEHYKVTLSKVLNRKWVVLAFSVLVVVLSICYIFTRPRSFIPEFATNTLTITVKAKNQAGYRKTAEITKQIEDFILGKKDKYGIQTVYSDIGINSEFSQIIGGASEDKATIDIWFTGKRTQYIRNKERLLKEISALKIEEAEIQISQTDFLSEIFGYPLTVELTGKDLDKLLNTARSLRDELARQKIGEVAIRGESTVEILLVDIDRSKSIFSGLIPGQLFMDLQYYTVGKPFGTLNTNYGILPVYVKTGQIETVDDIAHVLFKNIRGQELPLGALSQIDKKITAGSIAHKNGQRVVYVDVLKSPYTVSQLTKLVQGTISGLQMNDVNYSLGGQKTSLDVLMKEFRTIIIIAALLVYMLLSAQFESLAIPFIIFTTVPVAAVALALVMMVFGYVLNLPVLVGTLTLIGVVVNNAIVMIAFIRQRMDGERPLRQTIIESAALRLRPILMTTLTTIIALLPVALSAGEGSELESPIAWVVALGLAITTLFTLFVVPVLVEIFARGFTMKREISSKNQ
ncbi:MAG: efflux RND transporter permease subunit [Pseudothermotoga sp.]